MFGIFFKDRNSPFDNGNGEKLLASIKLGEYIEDLHIPIDFWGANDYEHSWKMSLDKGIHSSTHSALITSMHNPEYLNFIFLWVIFYEGEHSFVQNRILFVEDIPDFDVSKINEYIGERETINEDGFKISEWVVKKDDVIDFYENLKIVCGKND